MEAMKSIEATGDLLVCEELDPRRLVLMPLLVRVLALVAVMLLANLA
jgi:hypothetical protein